MRKLAALLTLTVAAAFFVTGSPARAAVVTIVATDFKFTPAVVHLKKGQITTLHLKAAQGAHGLNVPEIGLKNTVITAAGTTVKVKPMKAGTFTAHCALYCGPGHTTMAMKFIVK